MNIILAHRRLALIWLVLVAATIAGCFIRQENLESQGVVAFVLAVTMIKVRLVVMEFMELRTAPLSLRVAFDGWIGAVWMGLVAMPLLAAR